MPAFFVPQAAAGTADACVVVPEASAGTADACAFVYRRLPQAPPMLVFWSAGIRRHRRCLCFYSAGIRRHPAGILQASPMLVFLYRRHPQASRRHPAGIPQAPQMLVILYRRHPHPVWPFKILKGGRCGAGAGGPARAVRTPGTALYHRLLAERGLPMQLVPARRPRQARRLPPALDDGRAGRAVASAGRC